MYPPLCTWPVSRQVFLQAGHRDFSQCTTHSKPMTSAAKPKRTSSSIQAFEPIACPFASRSFPANGGLLATIQALSKGVRRAIFT
jgi:hypothetical protein